MQVSGAGTPGSPFVLSPIVSAAAGQQLSCTPGGLFVPKSASDINLTGAYNAVYGAPAPSAGAGGWRVAVGSTVDTTNVAGHIGVNFPGGSFVSGVVSIIISLGDVPGTATHMSIDASTIDLGHFDAVFTDNTNAPIVGGTFRVNWWAVGW